MEYSAIDIKKLWYADEVTSALNAYSLQQLVGKETSGSWSTGTATEIKNVHQDTWQIEESESSQDSYRNQLTGKVYRVGRRTMGDLTVNFTIGKYDFALKKALMGGTVITTGSSSSTTDVGWSRGDGDAEMYKTLVALTIDDVYVVIPCASIGTREASTDGAIGLAVSGTMVEPHTAGIASEYWFAKSAVDAATAG